MAADEGAPHPDGAGPGPMAPDGLPEGLLDLVVGSPGRYGADEMAQMARVSTEDVARLWRAMGFPGMDAGRAYNDSDLAALLRISGILERELLDIDSLVDIVRSFGQASSRLAEWQLDTVIRYISKQEREGDSPAEQAAWGRDALTRIAEYLPEFERLLTFVWRRHLAATLGRMLAEFDESSEATDWVTVGFADLVSFTRLSRQLDQESLAMLVQTFETAASDIVHVAGGRVIKTLGDEVMFVTEAPQVAAEISLRLHELTKGDAELPQMRVGLATGAVLMRMGDVFGTTVNRASRLTASARPGMTLLDNSTVDALASSGDDRFSTRAQTPRPIRGFGLMRPHSLSRRTRRPQPAGAAEPQASTESEPIPSSTASEPDSSSTSGSSGNT